MRDERNLIAGQEHCAKLDYNYATLEDSNLEQE